ncbi:MAG: hypothetical protein QOJ96_707 [Alphaproteobacteria bacterium]|nr:hypothetical protein [Alphaproteobacteria bacterium]
MFLFWCDVGSRKIDFDCRAVRGLAIDPDMPTGLSDEAVNLTQAQARSFAQLLCCEKRLEYPIYRPLIHSGSGICNSYQNVLTRRDRFWQRGDVILIKPGVAGLDRKPSSARHRIPRIDNEIKDRMFELGGVSECAPQTGVAHYLKPDLFSQGTFEQFGHSPEQTIYINRLWIKRLAARKSQ